MTKTCAKSPRLPINVRPLSSLPVRSTPCEHAYGGIYENTQQHETTVESICSPHRPGHDDGRDDDLADHRVRNSPHLSSPSLSDQACRSSRGIGLETTRQLLQSPSNVVIATCRSPSTASDLQALARSGDAKGTLHIVPLDTESMESIDTVLKPVEEIVGEGGLDYLLNNAAIVRTFLSRPHIFRSTAVAHQPLRRTKLKPFARRTSASTRPSTSRPPTCCARSP